MPYLKSILDSNMFYNWKYGFIISDLLRDNFYGPLFWIAYYKVFSYIKYKILENNNTKIIIRRRK